MEAFKVRNKVSYIRPLASKMLHRSRLPSRNIVLLFLGLKVQ